jgi:putative transposase
MMGRDSFLTLLRRHGLMLPAPKARCTTNSNHRFHKWKNLIKGFVPMAANQLWVADITYIAIGNGDVCYLHLITDAYSHKIIGWVLADTLRAAITKEALEQAISQAGDILPDTLIHHSDRGVQYCCDEYVETLRKKHIRISMTEDSNPTDNAIAERTNGIIKGEGVYPREIFNSLEHARNVIGRYIDFYNNRRPHMSIGYKVPALAHMEIGVQKKMWKNKIYKKKECTIGNNGISLPSQTKGPDDSLSHQNGIQM